MAWPRSLRWRYSLRALFAFTTLFMLWGGVHAERAQRERRAETVMRKYGGTLTVQRRSLWSPIGWYEGATSLVWRERYYFSAVVRPEMTEEESTAIASLPHLTHLHVRPFEIIVPPDRGTITSGAMKLILDRQNLKCLDIVNAAASPGDADAICRHQSLETVALFGVDLSGDQFAQLVALPHLEEIEIGRATIGTDRLKNAPGSSTLRVVIVRWMATDDEFAEYLSRCNRLRGLAVVDPLDSESRHVGHNLPSVDDEFIHQLGRHPSLETLGIPFASVTDACVNDLLSMPRLKGIDLSRTTTLSPAGVDRLQKARPDVDIRIGNR